MKLWLGMPIDTRKEFEETTAWVGPKKEQLTFTFKSSQQERFEKRSVWHHTGLVSRLHSLSQQEPLPGTHLHRLLLSDLNLVITLSGPKFGLMISK